MHQGNSIRACAMRITSLCLAGLLIPQSVPAAIGQQPAAQQPVAQQPVAPQPVAPQPVAPQQTSPAPPPLPATLAQTPPQSAAQDASVASQGELPSAPDPQTPTQAQQPLPAQSQQQDPAQPQQPTPAQSQQQTPQQPPALPQEPVGTAAAPAERPSGVPGSRPSGAAIAPAKQKRVRAFVISIGIALAGAAAIGTVVGLSRASHSTPQ